MCVFLSARAWLIVGRFTRSPKTITQLTEALPMSVPRVRIDDLGNRGNRDELWRNFSKFGHLKNVWVADDPPGFAYVFFETFRDAEAAVRHLDGERMCGVRVRVMLSPTEDKRAQRRGRGRGGGYFTSPSSRGGYGMPMGRTSRNDSRESYRGERSGERYSSYREPQMRSNYSSYSSDRGEYSRGRGRGMGMRGRGGNYSPMYSGSRGRGRGYGRDDYSPSSRGRGTSRGMNSGGYSGGYESRYSDSSPSSYGSSRGRGGSYHSSYHGPPRGGYRGGSGGYRNDYNRGGGYDEYENEGYRPQTRGPDSYHSRGRGRGGPRGHSSEYESRGRREQRREEYPRARERDYHSEFIYSQEEPRGRTGRSSDIEYREHRSRPSKDEYGGHRSDYKRHLSGRDEYRKHSMTSHDEYRDSSKRSRGYKDDVYAPRDEYHGENWEPEYRERSPHRHSYKDSSTRRYSSSSNEGSPRTREHDPGYTERNTAYSDYAPSEGYSEHVPEDELDQAGYEHVDQYQAEDEYHATEPQVTSDYETRSYPQEERMVEYEAESQPEPTIERYEEAEPKREVREIEYADRQESERYVKLEEKHYDRDQEREVRERDRDRDRHHRYPKKSRYSPRIGSPQASRRHHTPPSPTTRSHSHSLSSKSRSPPPRIRSPIRSE